MSHRPDVQQHLPTSEPPTRQNSSRSHNKREQTERGARSKERGGASQRAESWELRAGGQATRLFGWGSLWLLWQLALHRAPHTDNNALLLVTEPIITGHMVCVNKCKSSRFLKTDFGLALRVSARYFNKKIFYLTQLFEVSRMVSLELLCDPNQRS